MTEFTGLTEEEKDRLRDWWDEETTVSVESVFPEVARIVAARMADAWDERGKARPQLLGPHGGHYEDCMGWEDCDCASYPNPYRATEEEA